MPDAEVEEYRRRVAELLAAQRLPDGSAVVPEVTTGRESVDLFRTAPGRSQTAAFDWAAWSGWVVGSLGGAFGGAEPRYHYVMVVPTVYVGRATAGVIERALRQRWPRVYFYDGERLRRVLRLNVLDAGNMARGWSLWLE
jgi:hypothetical protein